MNHPSPSPDLFTRYRGFQRQSTVFGQVVVVIMMMTIAAAFAMAGARIIPDWKGGYLVLVALIIALEAIYTRDLISEMETREKIIFHFTEWIAFAVALKILLYLLNGPAQLLIDLPRWQSDFLGSFITGEYALGLALAGLVWLCSKAYAGELDEINERENDTQWDELGKLQNALHITRNKIVSRVFILGMLVVFMAIVSRIDIALLNGLPGASFAYHAPVVTVLVYFLMALVLLSQTQFSLLRTRWRWQRMDISPGLAKNWIRYGLLFFLFLAVVVFFLPTRYSIGLLDTLRIALEYMFQFASFLLYLITLPMTLCLSLFRMSTNQGSPLPPTAPQQFPPPGAQSNPIAWIEFLKSLAFWLIFLGVIIFAVRYYLSQNVALWNALSKFPLFRWLSEWFQSLWRLVKGANRQVSSLVREGIQRLRRQRTPSPAQVIRRIFNLSRMNPREKIIYFYLNLVQLGRERGLSRRPSETPYQYDQRLISAVPEVDSELRRLTDEFIEARYSPHTVDTPAAEQAGSLWERIKAVLREWKRPDGS